MSNIIKVIQEIYPGIEGGFSYWETNYDGSALENPIDGLKWENTEYDKPTWEQIEIKLSNVALKEAQDNKKAEINIFRDKLLNLDSPHTIGATYLLELNGEQVRFQVNQKTKTDLVANIIDLQDRIDAGEQNPTSDWIAVDNKTYQLTINDFKTLIKHLKHRSECLYKNARAAKDAILAMDNVEDIEAYDINNITIYD